MEEKQTPVPAEEQKSADQDSLSLPARARRRLAAPSNAEIDRQESERGHFARGINFYKLFLVFFLGSFAGVVVETIWCVLKYGHFESRAGLIYGPFNLVYGVGALVLTLALYRFRNRGWPWSFVGGFVVGGAIEYVCSYVQEQLFGTTSWDYSNMPFNLNGRTCLLYCAFWGLLGILWIKDLYPRMAKLIMKIPNRVGKPVVWVLLAFMIFNSAMSFFTVMRWTERISGQPPSNGFETYLDKHYPDEKMEKIYANMLFWQEESPDE